MKNNSKPLGHWDENGFLFKQEMLCGDSVYTIDIDQIGKHTERGFFVYEFLLCEENQFVDPHTSHPNRYWHKNKNKFIRLFEISKLLSGTLYLINYAKLGTKNQDKVGVIKVLDLQPDKGITKEVVKKMSRKEFSNWFRQANKESGSM